MHQDAALVYRAKQGDSDAFEALMIRCERGCRKWPVVFAWIDRFPRSYVLAVRKDDTTSPSQPP